MAALVKTPRLTEFYRVFFLSGPQFVARFYSTTATFFFKIFWIGQPKMAVLVKTARLTEFYRVFFHSSSMP